MRGDLRASAAGDGRGHGADGGAAAGVLRHRRPQDVPAEPFEKAPVPRDEQRDVGQADVRRRRR